MSEHLSKLELFRKVLAWRVLSTSCGFFVNFIFTGEVGKSLYITISTSILLIAFQWIFEVAWNKRFIKKASNDISRKQS